MTKTRSAFVCVLMLGFAVLAAGRANAQADFPNKPIHFIVGFAAGGGNDLFARVVVQKLQENSGFTTVISRTPVRDASARSSATASRASAGAGNGP